MSVRRFRWPSRLSRLSAPASAFVVASCLAALLMAGSYLYTAAYDHEWAHGNVHWEERVHAWSHHEDPDTGQMICDFSCDFLETRCDFQCWPI